jgi:hypothetical protein
MYTCIICRFTVELDDAMVPTKSARCVCLRCYRRETDTAAAMPKSLRGELLAVLSEAEAV